VIWGIHDFGQLCGSNAFDTYPYVEVICIRGGLLQNYQSEGKYASAAKAIASRCRSLRKLGFISHKRESTDRDVYLCIERRNEKEIKVSVQSPGACGLATFGEY